MNKQVKVAEILKGLKSNEFVLNARLPMGYGFGIPVLQIKNENLCMVIPYLKYQITGEVDKTLVYPIRNLFTMLLPEQTFIGFEDLRFNSKYEKLNFSMPVGTFRHEGIKDLTKQEYREMKEELYSLYDKLISSLLYDTEFTEQDDGRIGEILKMIIEPSLKPMYRAIDIDFYNKYIAD